MRTEDERRVEETISKGRGVIKTRITRESCTKLRRNASVEILVRKKGVC